MNYRHGEGANNTITIFNTVHDSNPFVSQDDVYKCYIELPKKLQDLVKNIFIEDQQIIRQQGYLAGFCDKRKDWIFLLPSGSSNPALYIKNKTIPHEAAHILDSSTRFYKYSSSREYLNMVRADNQINGGKWPSEYAEYSFNQRAISHPEAAFSDDFAESIRLYLIPETQKGITFRSLFPNRANFISSLLGV